MMKDKVMSAIFVYVLVLYDTNPRAMTFLFISSPLIMYTVHLLFCSATTTATTTITTTIITTTTMRIPTRTQGKDGEEERLLRISPFSQYPAEQDKKW